MYNAFSTGRGAVRLACLHGVQEVEGSNPFAPTSDRLHCEILWVSGFWFKEFLFFDEPETGNIVCFSIFSPLTKNRFSPITFGKAKIEAIRRQFRWFGQG